AASAWIRPSREGRTSASTKEDEPSLRRWRNDQELRALRAREIHVALAVDRRVARTFLRRHGRLDREHAVRVGMCNDELRGLGSADEELARRRREVDVVDAVAG